MACSSRARCPSGCWPIAGRRACRFNFTNTAGRPPRGESELRAVVLLSGGLDSYTAAAIARSEQQFSLCALTIDYGQRHVREIEAARAVARALEVERHLEVPIDLRGIGGSSLTSAQPVPTGRDLDAPGIPSTYVPARN